MFFLQSQAASTKDQPGLHHSESAAPTASDSDPLSTTLTACDNVPTENSSLSSSGHDGSTPIASSEQTISDKPCIESTVMPGGVASTTEKLDSVHTDPIIKAYISSCDEDGAGDMEQKLCLLIKKSNRFILDISPKV